MSDRITNREIKEIHRYMETLDEDIVILLRKLLATFNYLVVHGREWQVKAKKTNILELKEIEKEQEIRYLKKRIETKQSKIEELEKELLAADELADRYYIGYKSSIEKQSRLEKRIEYLENEINNTSNTENKEE